MDRKLTGELDADAETLSEGRAPPSRDSYYHPWGHFRGIHSFVVGLQGGLCLASALTSMNWNHATCGNCEQKTKERDTEMRNIIQMHRRLVGWTDFYRNINCWAIKSRVNGL